MKTKYINPFQPYEAMGTISILIRGGLQLKCNISLCHEIHSTFILNNDFDNYLRKNLANHTVSEKKISTFLGSLGYNYKILKTVREKKSRELAAMVL